jgi:hypothetical protein
VERVALPVIAKLQTGETGETGEETQKQNLNKNLNENLTNEENQKPRGLPLLPFLLFRSGGCR